MPLPRERALRILQRVDAGELTTGGAWVGLVHQIDWLPLGLQEWVWQQMELRLEPDSVAYLRSWSRQSPEVGTIAGR